MSTPEELPPSRGLVAGKYELLRLIGRGGMGSVWEGRHASLGTHVAIKFIEKEFADNEEARKRFDNEARAAAALQSKHAIQIHDHGMTEEGKPYIVMELLVGEPLDKRIERAGTIPLQDTARILGQVCRGLQKAHEHGIVHRDLKPENIFLVRGPDDDDEIAKVLDFGIAKIRHNAQDQNVSSSTRTGAVLGTPFYMSPEQARGLREIDQRTDLWSLGVIAFKCTTGRLPFEGESLGDLLVKICTTPIPMPSQYNPALPPSFDAWFSRALERDPNRRFGSATELAEALAYASGISVRRPAQLQSGGGYGYGPPPPAGMTPPMAVTPPGTGTAVGMPGMGAPAYPGVSVYGTPPPYGYPQGPGATSAPFVSSTQHRGGGGSRGILLAVALLAAAIGIALAVFAFKTATSNKDDTIGVATQPRPPDPPPTNAVVTPLTTTTATTPSATASTSGATQPTHSATVPTTKPTATTHPTTKPTTTATTVPTTKPTSTAKPGDFGAGF